MNGDSTLSPHVRLGLQCRDLRRFTDAERHFKDALAQDPRDDFVLQQLAHTIHMQDGRAGEALEVIDRAIAVDPNQAVNHAFRAFILNALARPKDALRSARTARELDPYLDSAMTAEAQAHALLKDWPQAERAVREALALDADDAGAANLLAEILRMQGKSAENAAQIAGLLQRNPDDEVTHCNAGWAALQRGEHLVAQTHFREALRLDPNFEAAREGLLATFRARSPLYRAHLRYTMWMSRMKGGTQLAIILGALVGVRLLRQLAAQYSVGLSIAIGALYLILVLWLFIADGLGNFLILCDRVTRHALRREEKYEAIAVGGGLVAGLALLLGGFVLGHSNLMLPGGALLVATIPFSMVFTNKSRIGALLFAAVGILPIVGAALLLAGVSAGGSVLGIGFVGCLLSTWLSNVPALRRR